MKITLVASTEEQAMEIIRFETILKIIQEEAPDIIKSVKIEHPVVTKKGARPRKAIIKLNFGGMVKLDGDL